MTVSGRFTLPLFGFKRSDRLIQLAKQRQQQAEQVLASNLDVSVTPADRDAFSCNGVNHRLHWLL